MDTIASPGRDVLLVCRNGHVITDLLRTYPEHSLPHCDRCGAATLDRCPTCGLELPGAVPVPGLSLLGRTRPPLYCVACGAAFPWAGRPPAAVCPATEMLETLLRRLPGVIRQLRTRSAPRPPFRVEDTRDLEDLLRALLPLSFDDVRLISRFPRYTTSTQTNFWLPREGVLVTAKLAGAGRGEQLLAAELRLDAAEYQQRAGMRLWACLIYDPEAVLTEPRQLEAAWSQPAGPLEVRCVIAS
jgi:hypothetical protein